MSSLRWALDNGGEFGVDYPDGTDFSFADCEDISRILTILIRKFKRKIKPKPKPRLITMKIGNIKLSRRRPK